MARPSNVQLRVAGIFESGFFQFDSSLGFMDLPAMQKIFGLGDVLNAIELYLDDVDAAPQVAAAAEPLIGPKLAATTWQDQNGQLLNALKMERVVTVVTIGLIQVVAALNILIALVMMVMEKHRDIAILMSMGARAKQIRRIFVWEGAMIGAVGTVIGLTVGYTICYFADKYQWLRLDESGVLHFVCPVHDALGRWHMDRRRRHGRQPDRDDLSGAQRHQDRPRRIAALRVNVR